MDFEIDTYQKVLTPHDSTTGGGSASAIAGAMAAALLAMVCRLSGPAHTGGAGAAATPTAPPLDASPLSFEPSAGQAQALSERLLLGARLDREAFQGVSAAFKLPREDQTQRSLRSQAIQAAWLQAARAPLDNAAACLDTLVLAHALQPHINPRVASDLSCALLLARAGVLGCLENVAINLPSIKDPAAAAALADQAAGLRLRLDQIPH
ncbi:MAG: cyclodeaminase/cyclohydrolase family protein [Chloroflexota bacterium]